MRVLKYFLKYSCLLPVVAAFADPGPMSLWFSTPGRPGVSASWQQEALPVGNGRLAAMVYGGVELEHIQFNEDTIWGGQPHDYTNPNGSIEHLREVQAACFNRLSNSAMLNLEKQYLLGTPIQQSAYSTPGALALSFPHSGVSNYLRSLDLNTATVNVRYDFNGVTYNRDVFASAPGNRVIVARFTASKPGSITFACRFTSPQTVTCSTSGNDLVMHGRVSSYQNPNYGLSNLVEFDARVRVMARGGKVSADADSISVTNADEVVLLLGAASNVKNYSDLTADYVRICSNNVASASAIPFAELRRAQMNDYQALFNRVVLDLGGNSRTNWDMGARKLQIAADGDDPQLVALDFQLGRYLLIAGSRPGSQALNLQGKWNDSPNPSWGSKMTLNINEEMNYWGAEVCNLPECVEPLIDMIRDLSTTGHKVAVSTYGSGGWVAHHNTDLWRAAAPCNGMDGVWPTGGAWLCQHLWWRYQYSGDTNWLAKTGYPLMKSAAEFFRGYLVTHPQYGWKVTCPSYSPEHDEGKFKVAAVPGPTMDNELLRDLFSHVIEASRILGVDEPFRTNITALLSQLPPDQIGSGGQLQEWLEDVDATYEAGHRHCSHLVGLFPGDQISVFHTPALAAAARHSVDLRGYAKNSLTPWACAWRLNFRTRLQDGDGAWTNLMFLYGASKTSTNLIFADNNRQMDSIFGRLSGIAEMFLQSQNDEVILLPALPSKLTNGMVSGLCARGAFEVRNLCWTNGQLTGATLISKAGNVCNLRSKWPITIKQDGQPVKVSTSQPGVYQFSTIAGGSYAISVE